MQITCNLWDKGQLPLGATAPFTIGRGGPVVGEAEVIEDAEGRRILITVHEGHEDEVREAMKSPRNISIGSICLGRKTEEKHGTE